MRFPDLLVEFKRLQDQVKLLLLDLEHMRIELSRVTPKGDYQTLIQDPLPGLEDIAASTDITEISGG